MKIGNSVDAYISNNPEARIFWVSNIGYFLGEGMGRVVQNSVWFTILLLFKCNVNNPNTIAFDYKVLASTKIEIFHVIASTTALNRIWEIADIRASSYADEMDLYHGTC